MAQAHCLSNVGNLTSLLAASHSFTAAHTSNRLNQDLAFPSSKGSGKQIVVHVAIVLGFGTNVITQEQLQQKVTLTTQAHGQDRRSRVNHQIQDHAYINN